MTHKRGHQKALGWREWPYTYLQTICSRERLLEITHASEPDQGPELMAILGQYQTGEQTDRGMNGRRTSKTFRFTGKAFSPDSRKRGLRLPS